MTRTRGSTAVMADRATAAAIADEADPQRRLHLALNYFPTPPWATRALLEQVIPDASGSCWEPAAGECHMANVLAEQFSTVWRTDVHDHGRLDGVGSFVGAGPDVVPAPTPSPDWIITNPPFALAQEFAERCFAEARRGFALLLRTAWLEGAERWERLFRDAPPHRVAVFVERVPMTLGRWDPTAATATAYAWFVWRRTERLLPGQTGLPSWHTGGTNLIWIPPGCRQRLEHADDRRRFTSPADAWPTLFDEASHD